MRLSIIIPVLNEAQELPATLLKLQDARKCGVEVILVDGGSKDETVAIARTSVDKLICARAERAAQMNAGVRAAQGDTLLFLHADTHLPDRFFADIEAVMKYSGACWGYFKVRLSGDRRIFRVIEQLMNWRTRLTGMVTGDLALFVKKLDFESVGGFPEIALMEDLAISKRLRAVGPPARVSTPVISSSRYWERRGVYRSIAKMWMLRSAYFLGVPPRILEKIYYAR